MSNTTEISPIGQDIDTARAARWRNPAYQSAERELAPLEELARLVIAQRIRQGLTQKDLAERIGTSEAAISRLESGQHKPTVATLQKVSRALGQQLVVGFEDGSGRRELATVR